jgi:hypothetical protein
MAQRIKRHKGCALCRPYGWRGEGQARKLLFRDLRRLGQKRRITVEQLDVWDRLTPDPH